MKNSQTKFWPEEKRTHGGAASVGKAKVARPLVTKRPMHFIVKSSRAKGEWSFLRRPHKNRIEAHMQATAKRFHIKVYRFANVGNHCHLLIQGQYRASIRNFLRVFTQGVMFLVTGAKKGKPVGKFWDALAFSRVVEWGRDWQRALDYLAKNQLEGRGIPRDVVDWWFAQDWDPQKH